MKKTTKEYAEKLADITVNKTNSKYPGLGLMYHTGQKAGFIKGYLKAIEENAVPELIEALEEATEALRFVEFESGDHGQDTEMFQKAKAALKKATS